MYDPTHQHIHLTNSVGAAPRGRPRIFQHGTLHAPCMHPACTRPPLPTRHPACVEQGHSLQARGPPADQRGHWGALAPAAELRGGRQAVAAAVAAPLCPELVVPLPLPASPSLDKRPMSNTLLVACLCGPPQNPVNAGGRIVCLLGGRAARSGTAAGQGRGRAGGRAQLCPPSPASPRAWGAPRIACPSLCPLTCHPRAPTSAV